MNQPVAKAAQIIEVGPVGKGLETRRQATLIKTASVEVIHLVIPRGCKIPTHEAQGQIVLHCIEGHLRLTFSGGGHELRAGQLLYLVINEPFSIEGIQNSSLLATIIAPCEGTSVELIGDSTRAQD